MVYNYHTHTPYCDGESSAEDIVKKAIQLGLSELGFSGHSYTEFDREPCMTPRDTELYKREITALKEKYKDTITILLGIECDYFSDEPLDEYEYVIGSVHYVFKEGHYLFVDYSKEMQVEAVNRYYNGDFYAFAEDYFSTVADLYNKTKCDIIGHFDLITKFNADGSLFDENHPRYIAAWQKAADALIQTPAVVEINTGAVCRGYTKEPYPSNTIIEYFKQRGKTLIFSSDCHNKEFLLFGYERVKQYL